VQPEDAKARSNLKGWIDKAMYWLPSGWFDLKDAVCGPGKNMSREHSGNCGAAAHHGTGWLGMVVKGTYQILMYIDLPTCLQA